MTLPKTTTLGLMLLLGAAAAPSVSRPQPSLAAASWVRIDGDSTLHKYRVQTSQMETTFAVAPAAGAAPDLESQVRAGAIKSLTLTVPVVGLRSGEGGLDDNLRKALTADKHPNITWQLDSYQVQAPSAAGATLDLDLHGRLTVAGVEHPVDLVVSATREASALRLIGKHTLSMMDYGVVPPVLFLGALKTSDAIVVSYNLLLEPKS